MRNTSPTYRTDEQLEVILADTGHWVVHGRGGSVLCGAASLGRALERAAAYAASGAVVTALSRLPANDIVIFPVQMERLKRVVPGAEVASTTRDGDPREDFAHKAAAQ